MTGLARFLLDDDVAQWVAAFLRKLSADREIPEFGSVHWQRADDRLRIASAVRAGEAWRRDRLLVPVALADELAAISYFTNMREADAFAEVAAKVRAMASTPTHAELLERRAFAA